MLVIDNVNRFDSGKYVLTLENKSGTKSAFVNVRVLDTPSSPQKFEVKDVKKDSVTLCWDPPLTNGGAKITNYVVEKRESTRKAYTTVTSNCTQTSFKVDELQEGGIFYFRVCAVNEYGFGVMAETKNPIKVAQVPMPPGKVDAVTSDSITLSWAPPEYDGGCSINNYIVEKRDTNTTEWQIVSTNVARTSVKVPRLTQGSEYQFRIYAVNRYGKGKPIDSPGITAEYTFKQPGPPSTPRVAHATKVFMLVTWNEPVNDGGSTVLGYHLERKERSSILWTKPVVTSITKSSVSLSWTKP
uniref:Fibronectin type-III domain-containing protein n=1 Tax=Cyprinus carpio carpio TaxID=630221 RepID=A0A9J7YFK6_CYPCA